MSPRYIATLIINRVIQEKMTLTSVMMNDDLFIQAGKDKAFIQELCYGTLRWYFQLEYLLGQLLNKSIKKKDSTVKYLLLVGLYQLLYMRKPAHAVISETVETCRELKKEWAKGLVNAVLRRCQREQDSLTESLKTDTAIKAAHPEWLFKQIRLDWPEKWEAILQANNKKPPMYLRINQLQTNREEYMALLKDQSIHCKEAPYSNQGILLDKPIDVSELPNFHKGHVSVQELAAQLAAELLDLQPAQNVLDACAAPGGKSAHILESQPAIKKLIAIEKDESRAKKLNETMTRLGLSPETIINDAINTNDWWDGEPFDRILLDAPCSATGVIRRHPDIKILRTPKEVSRINELQHKLLDSLWQLLKPGGMLVYATCSILKQENSDTIKQFIKKHNNSLIKPIDASWGIDTGYGKQILTGQDNMDGFFYSCIEKKNDS